ncbi:DDE-type integrase/transposase/recombinase [Enterobacteriaceae bacterium C34A]
MKSVKAEAQSGTIEPLSPAVPLVIPITNNIQPPQPNLRWVVGVSAIPTEEGNVNLGIIIDAFSGRIIRWGLHDSDDRELQLVLLQGLLIGRQVQQKLLIHFDSATRYTHKEWRQALRFIDPERKISRRGPCSSHQHVASFFHWLQTEKIGEAMPATAKEFQDLLLNFINEFNSLQRSESTLNPLLYRISDLTYGGFDGVL